MKKTRMTKTKTHVWPGDPQYYEKITIGSDQF